MATTSAGLMPPAPARPAQHPRRLTAWVAAVYGGTLLLLGLLLEHQGRPRFVLTLLATGLVALGLQPLHARLQRVVNRWMYGDRDDPAAVLARLGRQIQAAGPPGSVLDGIVAAVGQAMRLAWVAIELDRPAGPELAGSGGSQLARRSRFRWSTTANQSGGC